MNNPKHYNIGISYATEDVDIVEKVVNALKVVGLEVFFDRDESAELVGKNLTFILPEIYTRQCDYCFMFVSSSYREKMWARYEMEWLLQNRIKKQKEDIHTDFLIPIYIEDIELPGLDFGIIGFNLKNFTFEQIATTMYEKIYGLKYAQSQIVLSLSDIFYKIYDDLIAILKCQTDCSYKMKNYSKYDAIIHIRTINYNIFFRMVLDEPSNAVLKIALNEQVITHAEWIWDAEIYLENQQIYFLNYNFLPEFPCRPQPYTVNELSTVLVKQILNIVKEHICISV